MQTFENKIQVVIQQNYSYTPVYTTLSRYWLSWWHLLIFYCSHFFIPTPRGEKKL